MRIICDAPGQTCNRLWTYVASVAQCIAERERMMIIFFDWEPDGKPNHVGIVTRVENGRIYTVEGNSSDAVREKDYSANSNHIFGFGMIG